MFYANAKNVHTPRGVSLVCHERYFIITIDQQFTGKNLRFEAVDETGAHRITEKYAAKCGYTIRAHLKNNVQLRASYFSCHTDNKVDEVGFDFNLIATHKGKDVTHALHRTCTLSLPWSLREVTCEVNYMEVSVRSEITCPVSTKRNDWDNLKLAHSPSTSAWQVIFHKEKDQLRPTSLKDARRQDYVFDLTGGRLVFRTPYGQPHSFTSLVDGVPVEVVQATLFTKQSWLILLVDLIAACSLYESMYEEEGYMLWETPDGLYPGLRTINYSFGLDGNLLEPRIAEEKGYIMEKFNKTVEISIPYDAEGSYRESVVSGDLYEIFTYDFYMEQLSLDEDDIETRVRTQRTMESSLLKRTLLDENRTVLEENCFTIYLCNIPEDVQLLLLELNGQWFQEPFQNDSTVSVVKLVHPNNTIGYTLRVLFHNSPVFQQLTKEGIKLTLDIKYTLIVLPHKKQFSHAASFVAILPDLSPPQFEASCSESSIIFKVQHKPSNSKWEYTVGLDPLTPELAKKQGYIISNNSQTLQLEVPLRSSGYKKTNFSLQGFMGTFEILVKDPETSEVKTSTTKTCPFITDEFIVCSTEMEIMAAVNLSQAAASGQIPSKMTLLDINCGPIEADETKALFSFSMADCGSNVQIENGKITYKNEILSSKRVAKEDDDRVFLECTYPISSLHRFFTAMKFESDTIGAGRIIHSVPPTTGLNGILRATKSAF